MRAEHPRAKRETRPFSCKKNMPGWSVCVFGACYSFSLKEAAAGVVGENSSFASSHKRGQMNVAECRNITFRGKFIKFIGGVAPLPNVTFSPTQRNLSWPCTQRHHVSIGPAWLLSCSKVPNYFSGSERNAQFEIRFASYSET